LLLFKFLRVLRMNIGSKHIKLTPVEVSHCITFQGCACLSVSHLKLLKEFHNIFAYYVII